MRRFRIEVIYTMHAAVDADQKLDRIRALVLEAYPDARFAEVSPEDRTAYYWFYAKRLSRTAGATPPDLEGPALGEWFRTKGYEIARPQVDREVALRSIHEFLLTQAKDDASLKTVFDRLAAKNDAESPVCGTEPGKTLVYRDFGGKPLTEDELAGIEDGGVKFSTNFRVRVVLLSVSGKSPRLSLRADLLGDDGEGRFICRLVEST